MSRLTARCRPALLPLLLLCALEVAAQPANSAPDTYGDRQSGRFGDPGQGYFGNPGAGSFDQNGVRLPPPGAKPLGRVYTPAAGASPYISLPAPLIADAKEEPANTTAAPTPAKTKKKSQ